MNKIKNVIFIILIIIFTISVVPKELQNDTYFTIAIGEKIFNGEDVNSLTWHEDINFVHSGVFDIIITYIYNLFSFDGIYAFVLLIAVVQMLLYYFILNSVIKNKTASFIATIITTSIVYNEFTARAQILSFTIFLLEFYCVEKISNNPKKRYIIILIILPILLANIHSSVFPVYFAIYLPYVAQFILSKFKLKQKDDTKIIIEDKNCKTLLILFLLSFILGLCSSTTFSVYTDMFKVMSGMSAEFISELQSLDIFTNYYFSALIIITIAIIGFTKTKVKLTDCLYILGFGLMTLSAIRCCFFFYLISSICVFRILKTFLDTYEIKFDFVSKAIKTFFCVLVCLIIGIDSIRGCISSLYTEYINITEYPIDVANYVLENLDIENIRIYNDFNYGSYLEYKGIKVFIDSRSGLFTSEFNPGCTVLQDWCNVEYGCVNYKDVFEKYDITHIIIYRESIVNKYIVYDDEWKLLYESGAFALYEKL